MNPAVVFEQLWFLAPFVPVAIMLVAMGRK